MERVFLWDVMGTLVHDPFFVEMPAFFGLTFEEMLESKHPDAWLEFEVGDRTQREFLEDFFVDQRPFDHDAFVESIRAAYRWLPGMEKLLADLNARGYSMHAFSNYPIWYEWIEQRLRLSRFLEWTFVSCRTGLRKPEPTAYRLVVEELDVPASQAVFIDDRERNCEAARQAGIEAWRFQGAPSLRRRLVAAGLL